MRTALAATIAELETAARSAQEAETVFRRHAAEEIARLERARVFAFRRKEFAATLLAASASAKSEPEAVAALQNRVCREFDWDAEAEGVKPVVARFADVGSAVWRETSDGADQGESFIDELLRFEAWYEQRHGKPFWNLFDQYMPETPLVDF